MATTKVEKKKFFVRIAWGTHQDRKQTYYFDTAKEIEAFLLGAEQSSGWEEYIVTDMSKGVVSCAV